MKFILVFVILPGTWLPGREQHIPFNSESECREALSGFAIPAERGGWQYCTTQENETWHYENLAPGYLADKQEAR